MKTHGNWAKFAAFFIVGVVLGAGFFQLYVTLNQPGASPAPSLGDIYQNAIEDAMIANPSEVSISLTPIVESNGNLSWQGEAGNKSVLVVTFTKYASSYPVGENVNTSWGETWVTVAPEIQNFFQNHAASENVTLRAMQLLGLPPNNANAYFVEIWVSPQSLFRPTPDNEINDTTAGLSFPSSVTADYKAWFNSNIIYSYYPEKFPWTRLGYTYDWGSSTSHVGVSEFVLKQNSTVTVKSVTPTEQYLSPNA
jgi:hypothetical protein